MLNQLRFPRRAYDVNSDLSLIIFCDASKMAYGFCCYVFDHHLGTSSLLFSKCKSSPLKSKTIPTLELLSVFLALKCLITMLKFIPVKNIKDLFICVDAQIVLSWILSKNVKTKNIFARNRIKDIVQMSDSITKDFDLTCKFKYVPTAENSADLVTRGLSFSAFKDKFDFWVLNTC